jgi:hypothetical protein
MIILNLSKIRLSQDTNEAKINPTKLGKYQGNIYLWQPMSREETEAILKGQSHY